MLELVERDQVDILPPILIAPLLALYKLGRREEAEEALGVALRHLLEVGRGILEGAGGEVGRWWDDEARGWLEGVLAGQ